MSITTSTGSRDDIFQQLSDPGIYYVYENGKLNSPPGYSKTLNSPAKNDEEKSATGFYSTLLTKIHGSTFHKPPTLLGMCINFVAKHIEYVDSLHGFPELVGQDLFNAVVKLDRLKSLNEMTARILLVFSEAYAHLLLEHLVLKSQSLILENCMILIQNCFHSLTLLNLQGCRIGDDHEMIEFIGNSSSLKQVGLCHNALSDKGMQKMTAPMRMFKKGPVGLLSLDLSCNPLITDNSIRYIIRFNELQSADFSGTKVTNEGIKKLEKSTTLNLVKYAASKADLLFEGFETKGWAKEVVHHWLTKTEHMRGMPVKESSEAKKFYSRKKARISLAQPVKENHKKCQVTPPRVPSIVLKASCSQKINNNQYSLNKLPFMNKSSSLRYDSASSLASFDASQKNCHKPTSKNGHVNNLFRIKPKKMTLNLEAAIDVLTQPTDESDNVISQKKRKRESDSSNDGASNTLNYSIEEQDILSNYLVPSDPQKTSPTSLFDAMNSDEW